MFVKLKRRNCSVTFPHFRYRQVTLSKEKHEQFTPNGREPSSLALFDENLAVSKCENKDYKSKYVMYVEQKRRVNNCSY